MSSGAANVDAGALERAGSRRLPRAPAPTSRRTAARTIQTVLGLIWLLDGAAAVPVVHVLQGLHPDADRDDGRPAGLAGEQRELGAPTLQAQPGRSSTRCSRWSRSRSASGCCTGRTRKPALAVSFAWALVVWWFGEAFGMMFMNMASPLTGAPGAVLLYALIGAIVWPNGRPGGLLGVRGARDRLGDAVAGDGVAVAGRRRAAAPTRSRNAINAAPSGMSWLEHRAGLGRQRAKGNGLVIALVLACRLGGDRDRGRRQLAGARSS